MDVDDFWELIDEARDATADPSDVPAVAESLVELLAVREPDEIVAAHDRLTSLVAQAHVWPLFGAAYLVNADASDDAFDHFLGWLIGQGKDVFDAAVADPDSLAAVLTAEDAENARGDELLGAPADAYEQVTGEDELAGSKAHARPALGSGFDVDDETEMRKRYPRLADIFL